MVPSKDLPIRSHNHWSQAGSVPVKGSILNGIHHAIDLVTVKVRFGLRWYESFRSQLVCQLLSPSSIGRVGCVSRRHAKPHFSPVDLCQPFRDGHSRRSGSSACSHPVRRRVSCLHQPDIGRRFPRSQARDSRVVVRIDLVFASIDINGDEFSVVSGLEDRPNLLLKDLAAKPGKFVRRISWFLAAMASPWGGMVGTFSLSHAVSRIVDALMVSRTTCYPKCQTSTLAERRKPVNSTGCLLQFVTVCR